MSKFSTEAGYGYTVAKTIWIRKLLYDLGVSLATVVCLYYDNLNATYMSSNLWHIVVDYQFVHEWVADGDLIICYMPTRLQTAEIFIRG